MRDARTHLHYLLGRHKNRDRPPGWPCRPGYPRSPKTCHTQQYRRPRSRPVSHLPRRRRYESRALAWARRRRCTCRSRARSAHLRTSLIHTSNCSHNQNQHNTAGRHYKPGRRRHSRRRFRFLIASHRHMMTAAPPRGPCTCPKTVRHQPRERSSHHL